MEGGLPESKTTISDAEGGLLPGPVRERQAPNMLEAGFDPLVEALQGRRDSGRGRSAHVVDNLGEGAAVA